ncbi:hypothetical protein [Acutalibacter sp. 1XD8-36]|uniref:hypothetical protein n=1 Tax=Acutalibacter sp. 1XD8-36 TaxID=2320852 RepID=UPI001413749F|nr:hypothetical protein [Acutalibacter sp. 1XD8-36]NBJ90596.1 hypothetical protein [Acutalibacter sp. 1XD8-36]
MKITVFASNHPIHLDISKPLSLIAGDLYAIEECNTIFPKEKNECFKSFSSAPQDKSKEYRYSKNSDFVDEVAEEYINSS